MNIDNKTGKKGQVGTLVLVILAIIGGYVLLRYFGVI